MSRRRFLKGLAGVGTACAAAGIYGVCFEPFWPDFHEYHLNIKNLPQAFEGYRITQLTDLHAGDATPERYLYSVMDKVNTLKSDLVIFTGDLTTHDLDYTPAGCDVLDQIQAPIVASLGNHDYDTDCACIGIGTRLADMIDRRLTSRGSRLLRNNSIPLNKSGEVLWLAGLEDIYTGLTDYDYAVRNVPTGAPRLVLSHNPDTAPHLDRPEIGAIFAGHTHGGQVRIPGLGPLILPNRLRQYNSGHYKLKNTQLYVSRGVGCLHRVRLFCRPEIPTFILHAA